MNISEPTPGRLKAAPEFICDGRSVDFGGVSLAVSCDGNLQIYVSYSGSVGTRDDERGNNDIRQADMVIAK